MAYATTLTDGVFTVARSASAALAAESATLTDANIPPAEALDCTGLETVWVAIHVTGNNAATMALQALKRDANAEDGFKWVQTRDASALLKTAALTMGVEQELRVDGSPSVFFRIDAVTNTGSTTAWKILVRPGQRRRSKPSHR
jgi:hypothetical protein